MAYPITYAADFVERRSRLTTFFRYLLALPHFLLAMFYGFAAFCCVVAAWFAIVLTGRYPAGLYSFNAGAVRYFTRINGYLWLATDSYPPFSGGEAPDYPVRMSIAPPQHGYDRMKTLLRIIFAIPVMVISYVLGIVMQVAGIISWFWILITGKQHAALHSAITLGLSYSAKAGGYFALLTETWPPFSDEGTITAGSAPAGVLQQATAAPPAAHEAPPAAPRVAGLPDRDTPPSAPGMTSGDPLG